jgi:hypothetical protein
MPTPVDAELIYRITQDEPIGRQGADAAILGPTAFQVRAARDGNGNGRVYVIDYAARDSELSIIRCSLPVWVPRSPNLVPLDGP